MADKVMDILRSKYLISPIRYAGLQRIEELEYPEDALREAILNAIVHRDYTGAPIQLSVYDNKLMLWNPGRLPEGISIEILKHKHPSIPVNRNIAELFFKAGYIEVWGRGISKILNAFRNSNLPEPLIDQYAGGIQITFMKTQNVTEDVIEDVIENVIENVTEKRKSMIIQLISKESSITTAKLSQLLKVTRRTILRDLENLKFEGKLKRIGPDKGGHWEIQSDESPNKSD